MATKISWADESWNPIVGCSKISAGCLNCYAEKMAYRLSCNRRIEHTDAGRAYGNIVNGCGAQPRRSEWSGRTSFIESALTKPRHWRKPRKIFVCSMSDLFHESVPFEWIERVMGVIEQCPQHEFCILTKRPRIMGEYFNGLGKRFELSCCPNLHLGVTVENQDNVGRIADLIQTPAAKRFLSIEPLIGRINLGEEDISGIDKVIVGSESIGRGCGRKCDIQWVREIVQQCRYSDTKVHIKQLTIDGQLIKDVNLFPDDLKIQE